MDGREYQDIVIDDLRDSVKKLLEGQDELKVTVIKMSEAFKSMDRVESRIEKIEAEQKEKNKEQDEKIDRLRIFMYKAGGAWTALLIVGSILLKFIGV